MIEERRMKKMGRPSWTEIIELLLLLMMVDDEAEDEAKDWLFPWPVRRIHKKRGNKLQTSSQLTTFPDTPA